MYVHLLSAEGHATIPSEAIDGDQVEQGAIGKAGACLPRTNAPFFALRGCRGDLMVKRKCGTCRHFKDGGIAGSGWCQHQARKDIQHMVLVRRTELACRNSWDQDLWELADRPIDIQSSTHIPMPVSGGEPHDAPLMRSELPEDEAARAGEMFTDRITSISMPTRSQLRPGRVEPEPVVEDNTDADLTGARSIVREARKRRQEQRHIERRKHQETELQRVDDLMDTREPANQADRGPTRTRAVDGPMTANREERRRTPPARELPPRTPPTPDPPQRQDAAPSIEFSAKPVTFRGERSPAHPNPDPEPSGSEHAAPKNGARSGPELKRDETEPFSTADVRDAVRKQRGAAGGTTDARDKGSLAARPAPTVLPDRQTRGDVRPRVEPPPAIDERPTARSTGAGNTVPGGIATELPSPYAVDPIDLSRDLKSVRRCCATCRDFKQVGDGRSGWCNNAYAFSEKRMVQSNEIACRSSLGVWWLPHDDLWLEYADTTHHGRPTPLLDDMVGAVSSGRQETEQRSS